MEGSLFESKALAWNSHLNVREYCCFQDPNKDAVALPPSISWIQGHYVYVTPRGFDHGLYKFYFMKNSWELKVSLLPGIVTRWIIQLQENTLCNSQEPKLWIFYFLHQFKIHYIISNGH